MEKPTPLLLSIKEAAKYAGIGLTLAYQYVHSDVWPSEQVGKIRKIRRAWLEQRYGARPNSDTDTPTEE